MKSMHLKMPKVKMKVTAVLWMVFVVVVAAELLVLYKYLFLDQNKDQGIQVEIQAPSLRIDFEGSEKAKAWFSERTDYQLPGYVLQSGSLGRENPFAEY